MFKKTETNQTLGMYTQKGILSILTVHITDFPETKHSQRVTALGGEGEVIREILTKKKNKLPTGIGKTKNWSHLPPEIVFLGVTKKILMKQGSTEESCVRHMMID